MPEFVRIPRARIEQIAREGYAREFGGDDRPRPIARNIRPTVFLVDGDRIEIPYRGRMYELLPVSFKDGLRLLEVERVIEQLQSSSLSADSIEAYGRALQLVVAMAPTYLRPRGRFRRLRWRLGLRRNPFRDATDAEVGELLGFFSGCRTRSRVRYPAA